MLSFDDLGRAGHSVTGRAWITNPVRRVLMAVARPYFARILLEIGELDRTRAQRKDTERLDQRILDLEQHGRELAAGQQLGSAFRDELLLAQRKDTERLDQRILDLERRGQELAAEQQLGNAFRDELLHLNRMLDALRKDQMAVNYRLGSIDDQVEERQRSADALHAELLRLGPAFEALRQEQLAAHRRIDGIEATAQVAQVAGIATLQHNLPLAILGTSLVLHDGPYGRFLLRQPDLISDHILSGSFWDSHLKGVIERAGAADRTAIDAGAYLGFHSVYMARYFRTVHAFEPQVEIYRMLCANLLLNNCRNVIATNAALYNVTGHMKLADNAEQEIPVPGHDGGVDYNHIGNAAALAFHWVDAETPSTVPARTIDELGLTDLGFMKVDTQGSDLHVLRGARATIQRCRPVITAEFERELAKIHDTTLDAFHRFFDELDYTLGVLDDRGDGKQIDLLATPR